MFEIGTVITKETYTQAAIACNKTADRHIEKQGEQYIIAANPPAPEPTAEEQVAKLEAETGLTRVMREGILAEGSPYSLFIKEKALEIEELARQLRADDNQSADELTGATLE